MSATIDKDQILLDYHSVRMNYLLDLYRKAWTGAQKHLHRGLLVRINMMQESVVELYEELDSADGPLSSYLASRLTLLINAFYLNLAGSLDNLAWAIIYQHGLRDPVNEDCPNQRKLAQLLGPKFLNELSQNGLNDLKVELMAKRNWYKEMKEFRDPAAHRIPLLVPPSILSKEDVDEQRRLDSNAAELFAKGNYSEGMSTSRQIDRLGKQLPWFASETTSLQMYDLAGRINLDHSNWHILVSASLSHGFL